MKKLRHAGLHRLAGLEEIAALEEVRFARLLLSFQNQLRRAFGMLPPKRLDLVIGFLPLGNRGSPVTEDSGGLSRRALLGWNRQDLANPGRKPVGDDARL